MFDDFNDLRRSQDQDDESMDDLFAGFSDDALDNVRDPFATLDEADDDDIFSRLQADDEPLEEDDLWESAPAQTATQAAAQPAIDDDLLPPLPDATAPSWLSELGIDEPDVIEEEEEVAPEPAAKPEDEPLAAIAGRGPEGRAFGMTAQQRMILAIFLFLDVVVLGFLLLYVLGVIQL